MVFNQRVVYLPLQQVGSDTPPPIAPGQAQPGALHVRPIRCPRVTASLQSFRPPPLTLPLVGSGRVPDDPPLGRCPGNWEASSARETSPCDLRGSFSTTTVLRALSEGLGVQQEKGGCDPCPCPTSVSPRPTVTQQRSELCVTHDRALAGCGDTGPIDDNDMGHSIPGEGRKTEGTEPCLNGGAGGPQKK